jgi:hypothetical protein
VPAKATFKFENVSDAPVVITNVRSSCGCTVAKYTKEPVRPGETGIVSATYNSARVGSFNKSVTVTMDALDRPVVLRVKGQVVEKLAKKPAKPTPEQQVKKTAAKTAVIKPDQPKKEEKK